MLLKGNSDRRGTGSLYWGLRGNHGSVDRPRGYGAGAGSQGDRGFRYGDSGAPGTVATASGTRVLAAILPAGKSHTRLRTTARRVLLSSLQPPAHQLYRADP